MIPEGSLPPLVAQAYLAEPTSHPHWGLVAHCCFNRLPPLQ